MERNWCEQLKKMGLTEEDCDEIERQLGREPNELEAGLYGTMWCEHSGYRFSKLLLQQFDVVNEEIERRLWDQVRDAKERGGQSDQPPGIISTQAG